MLRLMDRFGYVPSSFVVACYAFLKITMGLMWRSDVREIHDDVTVIMRRLNQIMFSLNHRTFHEETSGKTEWEQGGESCPSPLIKGFDNEQ